MEPNWDAVDTWFSAHLMPADANETGARLRRWLLALSLIGFALPGSRVAGQATGSSATAPAPRASKPAIDDGWFDISDFLDKKYGFLPIASLITEPALGYGGAGGVAFVDAPLSQGRPDITFIGGMATQNGTRGLFGADMRHFRDGKIETRVAFLDASVNLDFYGVGEDPVLAHHPLRYNLKPTGGLLEVRYRFRGAHAWAGMSYIYAQTPVSFEAPASTPGLPDFSRTSKVGGIMPSFTYDGRDNFFTPTKGSFLETTLNIYAPALGGDDAFQRLQLIAMQYVPLRPRWFLGARVQVATSSDDTPFYMRPDIYQRGVPAMRYLGEQMAQGELELRWQFWQRISAVGFGGTGAAWVSDTRFDSPKTVSAGGVGLRYELARKYGLHAGADVAFGPDRPAYYIQVGSAWMR